MVEDPRRAGRRVAESLKTAVSICLGSRYPIVIWWGNPAYTMFYNDAYISFLGVTKHPGWLGQSGQECWREIWPTIGPMLQSVFATGHATWSEDLLLVLERNIPQEEGYFTFSYSAILNDAGKVGGIFCACYETTGRVLGERRLRSLRDLGRAVAATRTAADACAVAAQTLATNPADIPFALIYLLDGEGRRAKLAGLTTVGWDTPASPVAVDLAGAEAPWPFRQVVETGGAVEVTDLPDKFGPLPGGAWSESPQRAMVLPMAKPGQIQLAGFVVVGVSPRLIFNDEYKSFMYLLAGHVATAVGNARAYEEERQRAEALAEIDRVKTTFFSNVSHEFRTPLTLMLGPMEDLLARRKQSPSSDDNGELEIIHRNSLRLLKLVNTLLDFSRIEAGRTQAAYVETDLAALTTDLASVFRSAMEKAGLKFTVDCPPLPEPIFVDRDMWEKVVFNLLSNAFKFTLSGEVDVSMRVEEKGAVLSVRDTGLGIPPGELPNLFKRFHRIENAHGRTHEGTGIGLALVSELVKLHGGTIAVESEPGRGTVFCVRVPFGKEHLPSEHIGSEHTSTLETLRDEAFVEEALTWLPDEARLAAQEIHAKVPDRSASFSTEHPRILLAEDNADMRDYVCRLLRSSYAVEAVSNGAAALGCARQNPPDLILSDVMMPEMNGFELAKALRADAKLSSIPIILLSARAGEEARIEGVSHGVDDYLTKPFSARELTARVASHLELARVRREVSATLRLHSELLDMALAASDTGTFRWDPRTGAFLGLDENFKRLLGFTPDEPLGHAKDVIARIHPDDIPGVTAAVEACAQGADIDTEYRVVLPDGNIRWIYARARTVPSDDGEPRCVVGTITDITARKRTEEALRESEERYRVLFDSAPMAVFVCDRNAVSQYYNQRAVQLWGREPACGVEQHCGSVKLWLPDGGLLPHAQSPMVEVLRTGIPALNVEVFIERPDGSRLPVLVNFAALKDAQGEITGAITSFVDITERKQAEEALHKSEERFRQLADAMPQIVWAAQPDGYLDYYNERWYEFTGFPREEFGQSSWEPILHPDDVQPCVETYFGCIRDGKPYQIEYRFKDRFRGGYRWFMGRALPIKNEQGEIIRWFGTCTDVDDLKRVEEEREHLLKSEHEARLEADEANRIKDQFLATVSHELRTPLNAILGWAHMLVRGKLDEKNTAHGLEVIERNARGQNQLIADLLDVSRIISGQLRCEMGAVELIPVINAAADTVRPAADAKAVELRLTLDPAAGMVSGDAARLQHIVSNLLTNAVKFTSRKGRVDVELKRQDTSVVIIVTDTGEGISPEFLPFIFDRFRQAEGTASRQHGGLGLGLAIVRHLVELHGGTISAASEGVGKGAAFTARFPLIAVSRDGIDVNSTSAGKRSADQTAPLILKGVRVLVVDDEPDARDLLTIALTHSGAEVKTSTTARQAVRVLQEWKPDILVSDIGMPGEDGYELIRKVRALEPEHGGTIPGIALTGYASDEDASRARIAGYQLHMPKPVSPSELVAKVANLFVKARHVR